MSDPIYAYSTGTGYYIVEGPSFLYEISIYRIFKNRAECLDSKFITSSKPLKIVKNAIYKRYPNYTLAKFIDWLEAPIDYIKSNNFKLIDVRAGKRTKKSKFSTRK